MCLTSFGIYSIGQCVDDLCLLEAAPSSNFLSERGLGAIDFLGYVSSQIRNDQGLQRVGHSLDLFIRPVDAFILEFARNRLRAELPSSLCPICDLRGDLSHQILDNWLRCLLEWRQITPDRNGELGEIH